MARPRRHRTERKDGTGRKNDTEQNNDTDRTKGTNNSERQSRAESARSENMDSYSTENNSIRDPLNGIKFGCGLAVAALVILFLVSPQIASFFLSLSRAANPTAHNEVLVSFLDPRPTYTPQPTFTALPTYIPLPTHTPRPTYTPYPTPTPIPPAVIIQHMESQAKLVVVQNEMSSGEFPCWRE